MDRSAWLAKNIKRIRKAKGLTQMELAEAAGVSTVAIVQIETNRRQNPSIKTLAAIATALGATIDELTQAIPPKDGVPKPMAEARPGYAEMAEFAKAVAKEVLSAQKDPSLSVIEKAWPEASPQLRAAVLYLLTGQIQYARVVKDHDLALEKEAKHLRLELSQASGSVKK